MGELHVVFQENKIIVSEAGYPTYTFQIVDSVPPGYTIWNIGRHHMPEGYVPFCRLSGNQPFPGGRNIDVDALFAVKAAGSYEILDAIGYGPETVEEMEAYIKKHKAAKPGSCVFAEVQRMKKALPFLRKIKWR